MKITNLTIDGTECELGFGVDGKLYLLSLYWIYLEKNIKIE